MGRLYVNARHSQKDTFAPKGLSEKVLNPFRCLIVLLSFSLASCGGNNQAADRTMPFDSESNLTTNPDPDPDPSEELSPNSPPTAVPYPPETVGNGRVPGPDPIIGSIGPHIGPNPPANASYSIVYTSSPRSGGYPGVDLLKNASDVSFINGGFEETDLEIKEPDGTIIIIKKCTPPLPPMIDDGEICAAQEGRVSPDGTKIVYSLGIGNALESYVTGAPFIQSLTSAHLYIYDIATNQSTKIPKQGVNVINRMPDWLSNTQLVYSSDAGNKYPVKDQWNCHQGVFPAGHTDAEGTSNAGMPRGYNNGECISQSYAYGRANKSMQIWKMNIDGSGQTNLTPHEYMAIRPTVLKHPRNLGRIVYSSLQTAEDKAYYQGSGGPGTTENLWWLMSIDGNGADQTSLIGAHRSSGRGSINKNNPHPWQTGVDDYMAVRSVAEDTLGRLYFTNYYRGNHFGLGNVYRFTVQDFHIEGCSSLNCYDDHLYESDLPGTAQYLPEDLFSVAPFGEGSDNTQNKDSLGRAMGKLGYMALLSNGHMLATWGQGWCYNQLEVDVAFTSAVAISEFLGGEPVCDRQIVEVLVDRVIDPFDPQQLKIIAGDPNKHEWDAQEIPSSTAVKVIPPVTPEIVGNGCYLEVVDMRKAELTPAPWTESWAESVGHLVGVQGNAVKASDPTFHAAHIDGLAVYGVELWDVPSNDPQFTSPQSINYHGFKDKWLMGVTRMKSDGSVKMQVPCNQPFQMSGLDAAGTVIAHDTTLHSLRENETRTCYGCHEGHSVEQRSTYTESPAELFAYTQSANTSPPLSDNKIKVSFETDVMPILANRCSNCHVGFESDSLLWSRVAADQEQLDFLGEFPRQIGANNTFMLPRPYFSRLVARHPRWSPLYWGCINKRNDGYENGSLPDDIDFHPVTGHASGATVAECKTIADWIQLGAPNN